MIADFAARHRVLLCTIELPKQNHLSPVLKLPEGLFTNARATSPRSIRLGVDFLQSKERLATN